MTIQVLGLRRSEWCELDARVKTSSLSGHSFFLSRKNLAHVVRLMLDLLHFLTEIHLSCISQWARIVLATERMLTPKKRLAVQELYSKSLDSSGDRALIMRLRHDKDREQVGVVMLL